MKWLKKENGYTLIEMLLVVGLIGMVLLLLWTNYFSIHRLYIKESKKAQNLEEARIVANYISDLFHQYEGDGCQVIIKETDAALEVDGEGTVKKIIFGDASNGVDISYDQGNQKITYQGVEIGNKIHNLIVRRHGEILGFEIEIENKGHGVVADEILKVEITVTLQYTN